jgi:hypothetical protein
MYCILFGGVSGIRGCTTVARHATLPQVSRSFPVMVLFGKPGFFTLGVLHVPVERLLARTASTWWKRANSRRIKPLDAANTGCLL